ncbi:APC family permease [Mycoplasma sp. ES3225-GEN-MYC]|uniref:Amino acid permease n=1 Tax=Mycoplasma miroungigenitalium TaxID=754515 RepID=A0A6M4JAE4_9MOLU|nr:APC family permease [Mycoplasma miroungigenitalium]MBU4691533.1 APC family permease [Mycoplasma miroungigenitalium]QJR43365.1 amino acid permease [Mycoplasma miroungigenitalium]
MNKINNKQTNTKISTKKKISFFGSMMIVMGSSIGAGIFFKSEEVLQNSRGSLILAIVCWIIASFAVISMALALTEIAGIKNDNLSIIGWNRIFNSRWVHKASKNFMVYLTLPLTFFYMPVYVIMAIQDGAGALANKHALTFGTNYDWLIWLSITTLMGLYFLLLPVLNSKIGSAHNIVVLCIKFLPLVFITIIGFTLAFTGKGGVNEISLGIKQHEFNIKTGSTFIQYGGLGGFIGVFLSVGAIFFAYDGFYIAAGMQSEMKRPEKTSLALSLGLIIVTIIYVAIAISMSINGGSFTNMRGYIENLMGLNPGRIFFGLINIAIAIGVMGIINGFAMWMPRFIESLLAEGELPFWKKSIGKLNPNKPVFGIIYSLIIGLGSNIVFTIIGALLYLPVNESYLIYSSDPFKAMSRLYAFTDLIANWITVFTFVFIAFAILGAIKNKKTNKVKIKHKQRFFNFFAYVTVIFVGLAMLAQTIVPIADFLMVFGFDEISYSLAKNITIAEAHNYYISLIVGRTMLVIMLLIFNALIFLTTVIEDKIHIKKFGTLDNYRNYRDDLLNLKNQE